MVIQLILIPKVAMVGTSRNRLAVISKLNKLSNLAVRRL